MSGHEWVAVWNGSWPSLCSGSWTLTRDGVDVSDLIPEDLRHDEMDTKGIYCYWYFEEGWDEAWESYEDGLGRDEWVEANMGWLKALSTDPDDLTAIYEAFQAEDFRRNSCGGCI